MAQVKKYKNGSVLKAQRGNVIYNGKIVAKGSDITDDYMRTHFNNGVIWDDLFKKHLDSGRDLVFNETDDGLVVNVAAELGDDKKSSRWERKLGQRQKMYENPKITDIRRDLGIFKGRDFSTRKPITTHDLSNDIKLKIGEDGKILKDADYSKAKNRLAFLKTLTGVDFENDKLDFGSRKHTWDSIKNNELLASILEDPDSWDESMREIANDYGIIIEKAKPKESDKKYDPKDIDKDGEVSEDEEKLAKVKSQYDAAGSNFDKHSPYVVFDDNGNMFVTQGFNQAFGGENASFNDFLRKSKSWLPENDWLYGYSRYGNRLYKTSDIENKESDLYRLLNNAKFFDMNTNDNYSGANQVFKYLWDSPDEWNTFNSDTMYWTPKGDIDVNGLKYRPATGLYSVDDKPEGTQILEYYDPRASRNAWGRPNNYLFGLFDANGNFIENIDSSKLIPIQNGQQIAFNGIQEKIYDPSNTIYHGRIQKNYDDGKGNYIKTYWKPGGDMIIEMSDFNKWNQLNNGNSAFVLPKELTEVINRNPMFWENLLKNVSRENFIATLRNAVTSMFHEAVVPFNTKGFDQSDLLWNKNKAIQELGFTGDDYDLFYKLMDKLGSRNGKSTYDREREYLVPLYNAVEYRQGGGLIGTTVKDNYKSNTVKVENSKDINKAVGTDNNGLTNADKMQIASIVLDLGSLGLTAVPVYGNIAASVAGVGGTAAQFSADVKRDGLDWGDAGALAVGLGLDALTLIPGFGSAAKLGKIGKAITKMAPVIKGVLLGVGAIDGVKGLSNILSGNYSIDDFRSVANGLMAGMGIGRKVGELKSSKMKTPVNAEPIKPKTANDFKKEYIDDFVNRNPNSTKFGDSDVEWYDRASGTVTSYDKAAKGLTGYKNVETNEEFKLNEGIQKVKAAYERVLAGAKNMTSGIWGSKNNPLSDNFRWRSSNRTLGSTPDEIITAYKANPNAVSRLANIDEGIANELRSAGFKVETTPYVKAKVSKDESISQPSPRSTIDQPIVVNAEDIAVDASPINPVAKGQFDYFEYKPQVMPRMLTSGNNSSLIWIPRRNKMESYSRQLNGWIPSRSFRMWNPYSTRIYNMPERSIRYYLPQSSSRYLLPAPEGTQLTLFKSGGKIKKCENGDPGLATSGRTVSDRDIVRPDFTKQLIDIARHANAFSGRSSQSKLMEKSIDAARYNNVLPQYDKLSAVSGLGTLMQRRNAEAQALNNAYANVPKTSDFTQYLTLANSRAEKALNSERMLNLDINNLLTHNERYNLEKDNLEKEKTAQLINDQRRRDAAIESALWQERAGKKAGDVEQIERGLEQIRSDYNQHQLLKRESELYQESANLNAAAQREIKPIQDRINQIISDEKFNWANPGEEYKNLMNQIQLIYDKYNFDLGSLKLKKTISPFTGEYLSFNQPRRTDIKHTPEDRTIYHDKKGGKLNKSSSEMNHERILKSIENDNKRMLQLNENILKLLKQALK